MNAGFAFTDPAGQATVFEPPVAEQEVSTAVVYAGDLNGDGVDDLVLWYNPDDLEEVALLARDGRDGSGLWAARTPRLFGLAFRDLDRDGRAEAVVYRGFQEYLFLAPGVARYRAHTTVEVLDPATGEARWSRGFDEEAVHIGMMRDPLVIARSDFENQPRSGGMIRDLDGDGIDEVFLSLQSEERRGRGTHNTARYRMTGVTMSGGDGRTLASTAFEHTGRASLRPLGDADHDGADDLVFWTLLSTANRVGVITLSGEWLWEADLPPPVARPVVFPVSLTGAGKAELLIGGLAREHAEVIVSAFGEDGSLLWREDEGATLETIGDVDGDGGADLRRASWSDPAQFRGMTVEISSGADRATLWTRAIEPVVEGASTWYCSWCDSDFDGDGARDLLVVHATGPLHEAEPEAIEVVSGRDGARWWGAPITAWEHIPSALPGRSDGPARDLFRTAPVGDAAVVEIVDGATGAPVWDALVPDAAGKSVDPWGADLGAPPLGVLIHATDGDQFHRLVAADATGTRYVTDLF